MCAWKIPAALPTTVQRRRIFIPDDADIRQSVYGALRQLADYWRWEDETASVSREQIADVMQVMLLEFLDMPPIEPGEVVMYLSDSAPDYTLPLAGGTYDGADYPALFDVLDAAFKNPDGTFTLPNFDGAYPAGAGVSGALGAVAGANSVTLSIAEIPSHTHGDNDYQHVAPIPTAPGPDPVASVPVLASGNTGSAGGGGSHENRPKTVFVKFAVTAW